MQVIAIDNFDRDNVSDEVIATGLSQAEAEHKAATLNATCGGKFAIRYYVVKPDDYVPYRWEP